MLEWACWENTERGGMTICRRLQLINERSILSLLIYSFSFRSDFFKMSFEFVCVFSIYLIIAIIKSLIS